MLKKKLHYSKWLFSFLLVFSTVLSAEGGLATAAGSTASSVKASVFVAVNDKLITYDQPQPLIHNGTLFVPVASTVSQMNASAKYAAGKLTISRGKQALVLTVPGKDAILKNGRTLVSLRKLTDKFGYQISYNAAQSLYRAVNSSASLTDHQLALKYSTYIKEHKKTAVQKPSTGNGTTAQQGSKVIYITFDDGPNAGTTRLLDVLDRNQVKATFFMLGNNIASHPSAVRRIVKEGHGAGLHGMSHQKNTFYASPSSALGEMNTDNDKLHAAAGVYTKMIRPPYGSKPYFTQSYRDLTASYGYHLWDWNIDSDDWRYKSSPQTIYNNVLRDVKAMKKRGVTPIVLFHDQTATTSILDKLIKALKAEGYTFKPLTNSTPPVNFWNDKR